MRCKIPEKDLSQRLDSTVCLYKGYPYFVRYQGARQLSLQDLAAIGGGKKDAKAFIIDSSDEAFDISTIPLGYYQSDKTVFYAARKPSRLYKQGVTNDGLYHHAIPNNPYICPGIFCVGFVNMVLGTYPSLHDALSSFRNDKSLSPYWIALSREIAVEKAANDLINVYYKREQAGFMISGQNRVIIPTSDYAWIITKHLEGMTWEVQ